MARVLYLLHSYPQISETYMQTEIDRVKRSHAVSVATLYPPDLAYERHEPFTRLTATTPESFAQLARQHQPDIIHGHWLQIAPQLWRLAREAGTFFTLRSHSFDVLNPQILNSPNVIRAVNSPTCRGVLCFPFLVESLRKAGYSAEKIHACWPVVDVAKFRNRAPNGPDIMNVSAALPKKSMPLYVDLAALCPSMRFNLYMLGYNAASIADYARQTGSSANIAPTVQPDAMPPEYKKHRWLVYTASKEINTVGWPVSLAEAQASGVGVVMQNIRPDLKEYVGAGGYLFDTLEEARHIISAPFPEEKRETSFLHAEKSNVDGHIDRLYQLWS